MDNQIQLTTAELELIAAKRKEAEIALEKEANEKVIRHQNMIIKMQDDIKKFKAKKQEENEALEKMFAELYAKYPLLYVKCNKEQHEDFECKDYYTKSERENLGITESYKQYLVSSERVTYTKSFIRRFWYENITIQVFPASIKTGRYTTGTELKAFVLGCGYEQEHKGLKNILTAHKNIENFIATTLQKEEDKTNKSIGLKMLLERCKIENPTASHIVVDSEWSKYSNESVSVVKVSFPNKFVLTYKFNYYKNHENKMVFEHHVSSTNTEAMDKKKLIEALKSI